MDYNYKVQIFIPVYNGSEFISECIKSVLQQTYEDFQVCVVDNNSTDNTINIVKEFNDKRIKLHLNKENIGALGNFNRCLDLTNSTYFILLPCDDILEKNYLNSLIPILEKNRDICLAFGMTEKINANSKLLKSCNINNFKNGTYRKKKAIKLILDNFNPITHPIIRSENFKKLNMNFDLKYCNFSDIKLWTSLILKNEYVYITKNIVSYIRVHSSSLQVMYKNMNKTVFKKINDNYSNLNYYKFIYKNNYNKGFLNFVLYISNIKNIDYNIMLKKLLFSNFRAILKSIKNFDVPYMIIELLIMIKIFIKFPFLKILSMILNYIMKLCLNTVRLKFIK